MMQTCNGGVSHDGVLAKAPCTCQKTFLAFAPSPCSHGGEALNCIRSTRKINSECGDIWCEGQRQITKERGWEGKAGRSKESKRETMERRNRGRRRTTKENTNCALQMHEPTHTFFCLGHKKMPLLSACAWQDEQPIWNATKRDKVAKSPVSFSFLPYMRAHTHTHVYIYIYIYIYDSFLVCAHTCTHTHMCVCIYICVCVCVYIHI